MLCAQDASFLKMAIFPATSSTANFGSGPQNLRIPVIAALNDVFDCDMDQVLMIDMIFNFHSVFFNQPLRLLSQRNSKSSIKLKYSTQYRHQSLSQSQS